MTAKSRLLVRRVAAIRSTDLRPSRGNLRIWLQAANRAGKRYLHWQHSWKVSSVVLVVVFTALFAGYNMLHTEAATTTMLPNSDVTKVWAVPGSGSTHYTLVDDGATPNDADYVSTGINGTGGEVEEFALDSPSSVASASQIVVTVRLKSVISSAADTVGIRLRINGTLQTTTTVTPTASFFNYTATYNGSWSQADVDSMQVYLIRNVLGTGPGSSRDDEVYVSNVSANLTYVSSVQHNQSAYRWFGNQDTSGASTLSFTTEAIYVTGDSPYFAASADFNADGKADLVTANYGGAAVSILLGNGDGTFKPKADYPTGINPYSVTTADFNADGKADLVTANYGGAAVSILLGNGDGTFKPKADYPTGTQPQSVATADFNGDGKLDLAVTGGAATTPAVSILLGNGDGTFQSGVGYTTGSLPYTVVSADFDADGKLDLAVANFTDTVSILLGNGDGTFKPKADYPAGTNSYDVVTADFNADGKPDLAVPNLSDDNVSIFLGNGDGTFKPKADYPVGGDSPKSITTADFNGDGKADLATADNISAVSISILLGNGDGTFQSGVGYTTGTYVWSIAAADFNGDGRPDLATTHYSASDTVSVLLNTSLPPPISVAAPLAAQDTAATAPAEGTVFRLRLDIHVSSGQLDSGTGQFKLRYASKTGLTCDAEPAGNYTDVTGSSTIRYADNPVARSGQSIVANASDPKHGTDANVAQSYQEKSTTVFTNPATISIGQDGMWDFALVANHTIQNTHYCFKVTDGSNNDLNTYTVFPELIIPAATISQASYRWYDSVPSGGTNTFAKVWGGTGTEYGYSIIRTSDGGYAVTGSTESYGAGNTDMYLAKYDAVGNPSWSRTWGGMWEDVGRSIVQTSDGGYAVTGFTGSFNADLGYDMFLAKFDVDGNPSWSRTWDNTANEYGRSIVQTSDGAYAVTGDTDGNSAGGSDMFLVKYDASGGHSWSLIWGGTFNETGQSLIQTNDGGYAVTGDTVSYGSGSGDMYLAKFDASGNASWSRTWGGATYDYGTSLIQTSDGGYAVTGYTASYGGGNYDMFLAKYDAVGNPSWSRTWGDGGYEEAHALIQTSDGGYAVTGGTYSYGSGNGDMYLAKYDSAGNPSWSRTWGNIGSELGESLIQTSDGGYAVTGFTGSYGANMFFLMYDANGNINNCASPRCLSSGTDFTPITKASGTDFTPLTEASGTNFTPIVRSTGTGFTPIIRASGTDFTPETQFSDTDFTPETVVLISSPVVSGNPLAPQNKPLDLPDLTPVNLRIAVSVDMSGLAKSSQAFKLQYALRGGAANCEVVSSGSFSDITTSTPLMFYDNSDGQYVDGAAIAASSDDPTDGTRTLVPQSYHESNNFSNSISPVYAGQSGVWQFSVAINNATLRGKGFCLRIATSGGTQLPAANVPDVAYAPMMHQLMGSGGWFSRTGIKQNKVL